MGLAKTKTSVDILRERDALRAALEEIRKEAALAMERPDIVFTTICRVDALAARALDEDTDAPASAVRATSR